MSVTLRFKCDREGCEAVYDMPYDDTAPVRIDTGMGAWTPTSGWIDGTWEVPEGWSIGEEDLCPTHATVVEG